MWLTWYSSVLLNHRTLLCWIACSLLHDVRSCIGRGGTPLVWSHHASYSHHLLCLCRRLLTSRRCWRHLSCGRTEKNSDWRENDCTWSKDLSGRVGITLSIVIRGDWLWKAANINDKNNSAAVYVQSTVTVHNPLFSVGKLLRNKLMQRFYWSIQSKW